jgi:hypothetical protein
MEGFERNRDVMLPTSGIFHSPSQNKSLSCDIQPLLKSQKSAPLTYARSLSQSLLRHEPYLYNVQG